MDDGYDFILPPDAAAGWPQCTTVSAGPCRSLMLITTTRLPSSVTLPHGDLRPANGVIYVNGGDADGDGMPDGWELLNGFNPNDPSDSALDADGDGLTNLDEYATEKVRLDRCPGRRLGREELPVHLVVPPEVPVGVLEEGCHRADVIEGRARRGEPGADVLQRLARLRSHVITSQPLAGKKVKVEVPTHYSGTAEFANGAVATKSSTPSSWSPWASCRAPPWAVPCSVPIRSRRSRVKSQAANG